MPEPPDIEVFKRYLDATSLHQKIKSVEVRKTKMLENSSVRELEAAAKGREFPSSRRHGKRLFAGVDDGAWIPLQKKTRAAGRTAHICPACQKEA